MDMFRSQGRTVFQVSKNSKEAMGLQKRDRGKGLEAEVRESGETGNIKTRPIKTRAFTVHHMGSHWRVREEWMNDRTF